MQFMHSKNHRQLNCSWDVRTSNSVVTKYHRTHFSFVIMNADLVHKRERERESAFNLNYI